MLRKLLLLLSIKCNGLIVSGRTLILRMKNVIFHEGIQNLEKSTLNTLLIIDDQMDQGGDVSSMRERD